MNAPQTQTATVVMCEYCGRKPAAADSRYCDETCRRADAGRETSWRWAS